MKKVNKEEKYDLEKAYKILKALSHPMRIKIVEMLHEKKQMCVTEIYNALKLEQSTTSHHLGILKEGYILTSERKGKQIYYSLNGKNFSELLQCLKKCSCNQN